ncbi:ABC transporter permease [Streptomyces sp. NPDC059248]|uniref:ABC transporter permease n=1 Tax=Streptomyces sp. NPDC059248 TaxID=3346791 RepID=UPI00369C25F5
MTAPTPAPTPARTAVRAGVRRGLTELRQSFTNAADLTSHLLWPALLLAVLFLLRDRDFGASGLPFGTLVLPGVLGMNIAMGMVMMSQNLTADREDGTLLRARATPHGIRGYLIGKVVSVGGGLIADLAIFLVPGLLIVDGLVLGAAAWPTLGWVVVLGVLATLPVGAVLGSLISSSRAQGLVQLPVLGAVAISGIFHPVTALPDAVQWLARLTPVYWLGHGTRSALLPAEAAAAAEIGGSWRLWETAGVLGLWAVAGLALAPVVLRRMARRESGSAVSARRERAMRRTG